MLPALDLGCGIEAGDLARPPVIDLVTRVTCSRSITFTVRGFSTSVLNHSSAVFTPFAELGSKPDCPLIVVESSCRLVITGDWHIADDVPVGPGSARCRASRR
jgi:hypothetical protein